MGTNNNRNQQTTGRSTPRKADVGNRESSPVVLTPAARPNETPTMVNRNGRNEYYMSGTDQNGQRYSRQYDPKDTVAVMHAQSAERQMNAAKQREYVYARRNEERQRILDERERTHKRHVEEMQKHDNSNFEGRKFSSQRGWDNLGRAKGQDADGKEVQYSRGKDIKDYDARYGTLKDRMDQLGKMFEKGDRTGRGQEYAEIRKMIEKSHENGGLTEAQLEAAEKKLNSYRTGLQDAAAKTNSAVAYYDKRNMSRMRNEIGDRDGVLTDDQVKQEYRVNRAASVRDAANMFFTADGKDENGKPFTPGSKDLTNRYQALSTLSDMGVSTNQLVKLAVREQSPYWSDQYRNIRNMNGSESDRTAAFEDLGMAYLKSKIRDMEDSKSTDKFLSFVNDQLFAGGDQAGQKTDLSVYDWKDTQPVQPSNPSAQTEPGGNQTQQEPIQPASAPVSPTAPSASGTDILSPQGTAQTGTVPTEQPAPLEPKAPEVQKPEPPKPEPPKPNPNPLHIGL